MFSLLSCSAINLVNKKCCWWSEVQDVGQLVRSQHQWWPEVQEYMGKADNKDLVFCDKVICWCTAILILIFIPDTLRQDGKEEEVCGW